MQIGLSEIAFAAADMPLCLAKDAQTERFDFVALLGLIEEANLFSQGGRFRATYLPRAAALAAFRLDPDGYLGLAVDEEERSLTGDGVSLTPAEGENPVLSDVHASLDRLAADVTAARCFVDDHARLGLVRPLRVVLRLQHGHEHLLDGLYVISEVLLRELDDEAILILHRADRLAPAAVCSASLAQFERLRQLHNACFLRQIVSYQLSVDE